MGGNRVRYGLPVGLPIPGMLLWSMPGMPGMPGMLGIFFGVGFVVAGSGLGLATAGVRFLAGATAFAFEGVTTFAAGDVEWAAA